jgi:hypothetical protein
MPRGSTSHPPTAEPQRLRYAMRAVAWFTSFRAVSQNAAAGGCWHGAECLGRVVNNSLARLAKVLDEVGECLPDCCIHVQVMPVRDILVPDLRDRQCASQ